MTSSHDPPPDDLLWALSHDLVAPARKIRAFARLIADDAHALSRKQAEYLEIISTNAEHLASMLAALRDLHRIRHLERRDDLIELLPLVDAARRKLVADGDDRTQWTITIAGAVTGHRAWLGRLFTELLKNALAYGREADGRARIQLSTRASAATLEILVSDQGPGIAADQVARALTLFGRLHSGRAHPGIGAGLPLAQAIAAAHGGSLRVHTAGPGCRVEVRLPGSLERAP